MKLLVDDGDRMMISAKHEVAFEGRRWVGDLPFLAFPADWEVQVIPPFCGAIVRFRARLRGGEKIVSVYFDGYNLLGIYDGPYWEAYPIDVDTARFVLGEEAEMMKCIDAELRRGGGGDASPDA
jgi:hypothetical protein